MKSCWVHLCVLIFRHPLPLLRFGLDFSSFSVFRVWRSQAPWFVVCSTRCADSNSSSLVPNTLESRVLTNWSFHVLEKTPILFDLPSNSQVPLIFWEKSLGDMFTGQLWRYPPSFVGFGHRLLKIHLLEVEFRSIWEWPVWPVRWTGLTGGLLAGCFLLVFHVCFRDISRLVS